MQEPGSPGRRLPSRRPRLDLLGEHARAARAEARRLQGFLAWAVGHLQCRSYLGWRFLAP